jgi:hypothetical protein
MAIWIGEKATGGRISRSLHCKDGMTSLLRPYNRSIDRFGFVVFKLPLNTPFRISMVPVFSLNMAHAH